MSRYVEAEWLKEHTEFISYTGMWHETETDEFVSRDTIDSAPTIEIIRCRECKYYNDDYTGEWCGRFRDPHPCRADDFCSRGSRSEKPNKSERSER